ncbi:MAG: hypothetical protein LAT62_03310 [Natronospirillum sp.]|uniref:hypothetical protein n=1 Tax=Natronospirillum sp. TaxID=2812955 RepID=UPI0025E4B410|nr:hypothetical protein [Natronospirillum sp.]MCH8550938.1 hypothetical protein [Natronospirillum sp.]
MNKAVGASAEQVERWLVRPRLTATLAQKSSSSLIWLVAAGGYGKTTLALSYAEAQKRTLLRLPIPPHGFSVGEFFYALRQQAIQLLGDEALALPVLNPEYTATPEVFATQFGQTLQRKLPGQMLLFIDDMHHLPADSPLHAIIATTLEELFSERVSVIVASRHEPAPPWIRLRGKGRLAIIDETQLSFTAEESTELLQHEGINSDTIADLTKGRDWSITGLPGWAAGLMLLIEHWRRFDAPVSESLLQRSLDDWFLEEVYKPLSEDDKALLRFCARPRLIPASLLESLTGEACAPERLRDLHEHHAFLRQEDDAELGPCYQFHDLFRDFLLQQAKAELDAQAISEMDHQWGQGLWQAGQWSDAAEMMIQAGDYASLANGLRQVAGILIQTGRGDQLFGWLQALPAEMRDTDPHLSMWLGMCVILNDTRMARAILSQAWQALSAQQDYVHMAICWSGIVDSIWLEWAHISNYDPWIDAFLEHEQAFRDRLPKPLWYSLLRGMLTAYGYARPLDPELERWESETLKVLASSDVPDTERVMMASQVMYLNTWQFGRRAGAAHVMQLMRDNQDVVERASPLARSLWYTFTSLWALIYEADRDKCMAEAERGRNLIRSHGICTWDNAVPPLHCALCFEDREAYDDWMAWFMRTDLKAHRPFYDTFQAHFLAGQAWLHGRIAESIDHARKAVVAMDNHGSASISAGLRANLAGLLAESGQLSEALRHSREARVVHRETRGAFIDTMVFPALARIPLVRGQPQRALPYLKQWLPSAAREQLFFPLMIKADELSTLCALALQHDLEPDYAHWIIQARDLIPPRDETLRHAWPWRCRIHVLGRFDIELDGKPGFRLSQKRSRALMSELIMAGPDGLAQSKLAADLWPDSPEQKALNSLHVTVHRVREQLGDPRVLLIEGGQIRLNPNLFWLDVWEFMALSRHLDKNSLVELQTAFDMYQGLPQLSGLEQIDLEIYQESVSRAYERLAIALGQRLESNDPDAALQVYQTALRHLVLVDGLWEGIMRIESSQQRWHRLKKVWDQVTALYQQELGGPPPKRMQALYETLNSER